MTTLKIFVLLFFCQTANSQTTDNRVALIDSLTNSIAQKNNSPQYFEVCNSPDSVIAKYEIYEGKEGIDRIFKRFLSGKDSIVLGFYLFKGELIFSSAHSTFHSRKDEEYVWTLKSLRQFYFYKGKLIKRNNSSWDTSSQETPYSEKEWKKVFAEALKEVLLCKVKSNGG